jgi:hypothetical protein
MHERNPIAFLAALDPFEANGGIGQRDLILTIRDDPRANQECTGGECRRHIFGQNSENTRQNIGDNQIK